MSRPPVTNSHDFVTKCLLSSSSDCNIRKTSASHPSCRGRRRENERTPRTDRPLGVRTLAESVGFEPTDRFDTINALAGRPIRPLWQLSAEHAIRAVSPDPSGICGSTRPLLGKVPTGDAPGHLVTQARRRLVISHSLEHSFDLVHGPRCATAPCERDPDAAEYDHRRGEQDQGS